MKITRHVAAKAYALTDKSDPFLYGRMLANLKQGVDRPDELFQAACKRLMKSPDEVMGMVRNAR